MVGGGSLGEVTCSVLCGTLQRSYDEFWGLEGLGRWFGCRVRLLPAPGVGGHPRGGGLMPQGSHGKFERSSGGPRSPRWLMDWSLVGDGETSGLGDPVGSFGFHVGLRASRQTEGEGLGKPRPLRASEGWVSWVGPFLGWGLWLQPNPPPVPTGPRLFSYLAGPCWPLEAQVWFL